MSTALDANVLLYASDSSSPYHERAQSFLRELAEAPTILYLFWPVIMAYLRIATHPAIFENPLAPAVAASNVEGLLRLPHVRTEGEMEGFWSVWRATTEGLAVRGNAVPDAHLVALMRQHGVGTVFSRDRDLKKFDAIRVVNPFEG
jgi:toxin-antitoxin system PIN domain toxin